MTTAATETKTSPRGLLMVFMGPGKGKTTAALGMALRAVGHGMKVLMIQFLKANRKTGEYIAAQSLAPQFTLETMGAGFVCGQWRPEDIAAAQEAWNTARQAIFSGEWNLIILDEVTYCTEAGVISTQEMLETLAARPPGLHVVITGRKAPPELIAAADLVTDMQCVKHPYDQGIPAQPGVEF